MSNIYRVAATDIKQDNRPLKKFNVTVVFNDKNSGMRAGSKIIIDVDGYSALNKMIKECNAKAVNVSFHNVVSIEDLYFTEEEAEAVEYEDQD